MLYPVNVCVADVGLNNSMKSFLYVAPEFPPPPYTCEITTVVGEAARTGLADNTTATTTHIASDTIHPSVSPPLMALPPPPRNHISLRNHPLKPLSRNIMRTGASHKRSPLPQHLDCTQVKLLIPTHRRLCGTLRLRKCRWIQDNRVVLLSI